MAVYLNTNNNLENYKELYRSKYFIDKSLIIDNLNTKEIDENSNQKNLGYFVLKKIYKELGISTLLNQNQKKLKKMLDKIALLL